jgi:Cof subfamily protein (haloacid dehalogenase superfamily)
MDNTLLTADEGVPVCNRAVIRLFTEMGGHFTVSTGRVPDAIRAALGDISLSLPAISCSGALLYDFAKNKVLRRMLLEREQAAVAIRDVQEHFPMAGIEVVAGTGQTFVIHANSFTHSSQQNEKINTTCCPLEYVPDGWMKAAFTGDDRLILQVRQYTKNHYYGRDNYFLPRGLNCLELMPSGADKASAMRDICTLLGVPIQKTIVIGDYFNDIDLMKAAGYSVAVADSPQEVRVVADEVTVCSCKDGAVGEYLYKLMTEVCGRDL